MILFLQAFFCGFGQDNLPLFISDSLDNYINRALKTERLPGLAIAVVKDGKVILAKGYGVKEWGKSDPVDENTLFMIGSNTKAFTAISLALLQSEGKLTLNDPVTKWIPEFKLDNKAAGEQAIIRDILSHRIGFRTFQGDFTYWKSDLGREDVIERMGHIKAVYPFRTKYGYCNAAFTVAGQIIPRATGIQWEDFVKQRIFDPLGMTRTLPLNAQMPSAVNRTVPHDIVKGQVISVPYCSIDNMAPAGSICSSVNDMSKWMIMLLNKGSYEGKKIVPENAFDEVWYPHSIIGTGGAPFNRGHFELYGLGFDIREYEDHLIISHTGGVTGYLSSVTLVPDQKLGIVILTNSIRNTLFYSLAGEVTDAFLGLPYRNYEKFFYDRERIDMAASAYYRKQKEDSVSMHLKTALPLEKYTGEYTNDVYGKMTVLFQNNELHMKFSHHAFDVTLGPLGGNRFYAVFSDPEFETAVFPFQVEEGKVKSVTVKVADFIEYTPYIFTKQDKN
jgi:CubicO group peptidase (beta-lactamase class C family)